MAKPRAKEAGRWMEGGLPEVLVEGRQAEMRAAANEALVRGLSWSVPLLYFDMYECTLSLVEPESSPALRFLFHNIST